LTQRSRGVLLSTLVLPIQRQNLNLEIRLCKTVRPIEMTCTASRNYYFYDDINETEYWPKYRLNNYIIIIFIYLYDMMQHVVPLRAEFTLAVL
jgi:hypothetical protein